MTLPIVVIFGGNGKTSLAVTKLLVKRKYLVKSVIRNSAQMQGLKLIGAEPILQDLVTASIKDFHNIVAGAKYVIWSAGATNPVDAQATDAVDHQAFVRVLDAVEQCDETSKPARFLTVSAIDNRDMSQPAPSYYTDADRRASRELYDAYSGLSLIQNCWRYNAQRGPIAAAYCDAKLKADQNLWKRTAFSWTILRPGWLTDEPAQGTAAVGFVKNWSSDSAYISREDVATAIMELLENPKADNLALDIIGGSEMTIRQAIDQAIARRETQSY